MALVAEIIATWRAPRQALRARVAQDVREDIALMVLLAALGFSFLAQWPGLARSAHLQPEMPLAARLIGSFLAGLGVVPLAYLLAAASHLVARALGGQGSWYGARLALFWSLLAVSPLMLLHGLLTGLLGSGPMLNSAGLVVAMGFLYLWLPALAASERACANPEM